MIQVRAGTPGSAWTARQPGATSLVDVVSGVVDEHDVVALVSRDTEAGRCQLEEFCLMLLHTQVRGVEHVVDRHHRPEPLPEERRPTMLLIGCQHDLTAGITGPTGQRDCLVDRDEVGLEPHAEELLDVDVDVGAQIGQRRTYAVLDRASAVDDVIPRPHEEGVAELRPRQPEAPLHLDGPVPGSASIGVEQDAVDVEGQDAHRFRLAHTAPLRSTR